MRAKQLTYYKRNNQTILNRAKDYYKKNKERLREKAKNKHKELSEEEKNIKRKYGRNRYHNMYEENKQRLEEQEKIIVIQENNLVINILIKQFLNFMGLIVYDMFQSYIIIHNIFVFQIDINKSLIMCH